MKKTFEKHNFDEKMSEKQIQLIDELLEKSTKNKLLVNEKELFAVLNK